VKYGYSRTCRRKFGRKFRDERFPSTQTFHHFVNKLRIMELLVNKKQNRLEQPPRKSLKYVAQEIGVSKSTARRAARLLKPSSGLWCAVSARRIVVPVFFNETVSCEIRVYLHVEGQHFQNLMLSVNYHISFRMLSAVRNADSSAKFVRSS
jgi:hypothetical protein